MKIRQKINKRQHQKIPSGFIISLLFISMATSPSIGQVTAEAGWGTTISPSGGGLDITTTHIYNNFAVNKFDNFQVNTSLANEVRLHLPVNGASQQVNFLVNKVGGLNPIQIDTTLRSILDSNGQTGGTVLFASPNGINLGPNANINVGSLILTTSNFIDFDPLSSPGSPMDLLNSTDAQYASSGGINISIPLNLYSNYSFITNDGVINANGNGTIGNPSPSIIMHASEITNNGTLRAFDSNTNQKLIDGRINLVICSDAEYNFSDNDLMAIYPNMVNSGNLINAGLVEARQGTIKLIAFSEEFSPTENKIINNGTLITDAINPNSAAGDIELKTIAPSVGNTNDTIINNGLISSRSTLNSVGTTFPGGVSFFSDHTVINNSVDVTGQTTNSESGSILFSPSLSSLTPDIIVGNTPSPVPGFSSIDNSSFANISNTQALNPPLIKIEYVGDILLSNINLPAGLEFDFIANNQINITPSSTNVTQSSLELEGQGSILARGTLTGNFDNSYGYNKFLALRSPQIQFGILGDGHINLNSLGNSFPVYIETDDIINKTQLDIQNYEVTSQSSGILAFKPWTPSTSVDINPLGIDFATLPGNEITFNNINLGINGGGSLLIGNTPSLITSNNFYGDINITGEPSNLFSSFNNGFFLFNTDSFGATNGQINVSNSNFEQQNQEVVLQAKGNINANSLTNNFGNLSILSPGTVQIFDNFNGINIAPITKGPYTLPVGVNTLQVNSTNGQLNISGQIGNVIAQSSNGEINFLTTSPSNLVNLSSPQMINVQSNSNLLISGPVQVNANTTIAGNYGILINSPNLIFSPGGFIEASSNLGLVSIPVVIQTDTITNGNIFTGTPLLNSYNALNQNGLIEINRLTPGDIFLTNSGIDINGSGNVLTYNNINTGTSGGLLSLGNYLNPTMNNVNKISVNGFAPTNFDLALTSSSSDPSNPAINIINSSFNNHLLLQANNVPSSSTAININNSFLNGLTANTSGLMDIINPLSDIKISDYQKFGQYFTSNIFDLNISNTSNIFQNIEINSPTNQISTNIKRGNISINGNNNLNIKDVRTGEGNIDVNNDGPINILQNLSTNNGYINLVSGTGELSLNTNSSISATGNTYPNKGNIVIERKNTIGDINLSFNPGSNIIANTISDLYHGSIWIGDPVLTNQVNIFGNISGTLSNLSPIKESTRVSGPTGNILSKEIFIRTIPKIVTENTSSPEVIADIINILVQKDIITTQVNDPNTFTNSTEVINISENESNTTDSNNETITYDNTDDSDDSKQKVSTDEITSILLEDNADSKVNNYETLEKLFNICDKSSACKGVESKENQKLLVESIVLDKIYELTADKYGTIFSSESGYHPAGLKGFLMSLKKIEKLKKNNLQKATVFSYRHPGTNLRIDKVDKEITLIKKDKTYNKKINKKEFTSMLEKLTHYEN